MAIRRRKRKRKSALSHRLLPAVVAAAVQAAAILTRRKRRRRIRKKRKRKRTNIARKPTRVMKSRNQKMPSNLSATTTSMQKKLRCPQDSKAACKRTLQSFQTIRSSKVLTVGPSSARLSHCRQLLLVISWHQVARPLLSTHLMESALTRPSRSLKKTRQSRCLPSSSMSPSMSKKQIIPYSPSPTSC